MSKLRHVRIQASDTAHLTRVWVDGELVTNLMAYKVEAGLPPHGPELTTVTLVLCAVEVEMDGYMKLPGLGHEQAAV